MVHKTTGPGALGTPPPTAANVVDVVVPVVVAAVAAAVANGLVAENAGGGVVGAPNARAPPPVREYPEGELEVAVEVEVLVPDPPKAGAAVVVEGAAPNVIPVKVGPNPPKAGAAVVVVANDVNENDGDAANTGAGGAAPTAPEVTWVKKRRSKKR